MTDNVRVVLSILLGLGYVLPVAVVDELSSGHGWTAPAVWRIATWLLAALYLAVAQFLVARKGQGFRATGPTLVAMVTPVVLMCLLGLAIEPQANTAQAPWWLLSCFGALAGAAGAAVWRTRAGGPQPAGPERGGLYWAPRALAIFFILQVSMLAVNVFHEHLGPWQTMLARAIHLIQTLCVVAVLAVAWRWERIGAMLFAVAGAFFAHAAPVPGPGKLILGREGLVTALLFLVSWRSRMAEGASAVSGKLLREAN